MTFLSTQRIYIEDVDAQGIVYHANYLKFFERARTEFLRESGFDLWAHAEKTETFFVMRHCELDFKRPASLDDLVTIKTSVTSASGTRLRFEQSLEKEGETLVTLHSLLAHVTQAGQPLRLPEKLHSLLVSLSTKKPARDSCELSDNTQPQRIPAL